jgi:L-lactate dehydrogenase (cytochrome)
VIFLGGGRHYLYTLAVAGQAGVERAFGVMRAEIDRGVKLMACTSVNQLSRENLGSRHYFVNGALVPCPMLAT